MSHLHDPLGALLAPTAETSEHVASCAACAGTLKAARSAIAPSGASLPDPSRIRTLAGRRRDSRRRRRSALALFLGLALGLWGKVARDAHVASVDLADDQLLRSIGSYRDVPDLGGLGGWVEAGLEDEGTGLRAQRG